MILFRTSSQKIAANIVSKTYYTANNEKNDQVVQLEINTLSRYLNSLVNIIRNNNTLFLPYFGAFSKGLPIIELILFTTSLITRKKNNIIYYGDGFLQSGRSKHLIPIKQRIIFREITKTWINYQEHYAFDVGNGFNFTHGIRLETQHVLTTITDYLPQPVQHYTSKQACIVIPMFNCVSNKRLTEHEAHNFWENLISTLKKNYPRHILVLITHPAEKKHFVTEFKKNNTCNNLYFSEQMFELFILTNLSTIKYILYTSIGSAAFCQVIQSSAKFTALSLKNEPFLTSISHLLPSAFLSKLP